MEYGENEERDGVDDLTGNAMTKRFHQNTITSYSCFRKSFKILNLPLIAYACERIEAINRERCTKTSLSIVVNGTLINERFINLVKRYELSVTVSYDGDPAINDRLRVFPNGSGSSKIILDKIRMLKKATGQPNTIEATYTQFHSDAGVTLLSIVKDLQGQFPGTEIHIAPAAGLPSCSYVLKDLQPYVDSMPELCDYALNHPDDTLPAYSIANDIFSDLKEKDIFPGWYICDAGIGTLSVSTKGDIYPCFMLTDMEEMYFGNVMDDDVFRSERFHAVQDQLIHFNDRTNQEECQNCYLGPMCRGCIGLNYLMEGKLLTLSPKICEMNRAMYEEAIKGLARIQEAEAARGEGNG